MSTAIPKRAAAAPVIEVDLKYGGVYAGSSFAFSPAVAQHFNDKARSARNMLPGEFVAFEAGDHCSIACPTSGMPREQFVAAYQQLRTRLDGELEFHLADYPRLFSNHPRERDVLRGVPTYIPKSKFPQDFFGKPHMLELFQGDQLIFGPAQRFFHTASSGSLLNVIEDGHGRLVLDVTGNLSLLQRVGQIVFFTDPEFGEPLAARQLNDDGSTNRLEYDLLGKDHVGDTMLFNEGVVLGIEPVGSRVVIELLFPKQGRGLAAALFSGHTRETAFRIDAAVM